MPLFDIIINTCLGLAIIAPNGNNVHTRGIPNEGTGEINLFQRTPTDDNEMRPVHDCHSPHRVEPVSEYILRSFEAEARSIHILTARVSEWRTMNG